jgi:putative flippase GtrA
MKTLMSKFPALRQVIRYGVVGVLNNLLGYLIYLLITFYWLDPMVAVSLLYPVGAATAYFGHSKYAFTYQGKNTHALARYIIAHLIAYGVNLLMLYILWDKLKLPHQIVQAAAIFVVAGVLFLLFRYFVFPHSKIDQLSRS